MHFFCYNLLVENQYPQKFIQDKKNNKLIKPFNFFVVFVLISTIFAFILGGFFIGKENEKKETKNEKTIIKEQMEIDSKTLSENSDNWIVYKLKPLNLQFKLPEELNRKSDWKVSEISGDSGKQICFSNEELGDDKECKGKILVISSTSKDFSAKRKLNFLDSQGFEKENEKYYVNTLSKKFELENVKLKSFENNENFKIIKVVGKENLLDEAQTDRESLENGYLWAIVNTKNSNFPAVVLRMEIGDEISEYEFDQILESLRIIE